MMKLTPTGKDWAAGPWKNTARKHKQPFIEREVFGWIAVAIAVMFVAWVAQDAVSGAIYDQINRDPMDVLE